MKRTILSIVAVVLGSTFATSAFAQQDAKMGTAPASSTSTTPIAAKVEDDSPDHERFVGHFAVGYFGISQIPIAVANGGANLPAAYSTANPGSVTTPIIGARYWLRRGIGIDAGIGLGFQGGSTTATTQTTAGGNTTTTTTNAPNTNNAFGFAIHGGVPFALAEGHHYVFEFVPETTLGFATSSVHGAPNNPGHRPERRALGPRRPHRRGASLRVHWRARARAPGLGRSLLRVQLDERQPRRELRYLEQVDPQYERERRSLGHLRGYDLRALLLLEIGGVRAMRRRPSLLLPSLLVATLASLGLAGIAGIAGCTAGSSPSGPKEVVKEPAPGGEEPGKSGQEPPGPDGRRTAPATAGTSLRRLRRGAGGARGGSSTTCLPCAALTRARSPCRAKRPLLLNRSPCRERTAFALSHRWASRLRARAPTPGATAGPAERWTFRRAPSPSSSGAREASSWTAARTTSRSRPWRANSLRAWRPATARTPAPPRLRRSRPRAPAGTARLRRAVRRRASSACPRSRTS